MKTAILATLIASASAFAPAQTARTSSALNVDVTKEIGALTVSGLYTMELE